MRKKVTVRLIVFFISAYVCLSFAPKFTFAIENLQNWHSSEFTFNNPGARSRGIGAAFVGKADDGSAAITNPAGIAQLPGVQIYVEGRFTTWDTQHPSWPNNPNAVPGVTLAGTTITTGEEGRVNFDDMMDLSFASIAFPVKYAPFYINFNASFFYNKLAHSDVEMSLPMSNQATGFFPLEGYESDNEIEIDEFGFTIAKSLFKDKLLIGGSVSLQLLDIDGTWGTTGVDDAGIDHDPFGLLDFYDQKATFHDHEQEWAFRFGVLYSVTDKLKIGASAQLMPNFDYDTTYDQIVGGSTSSFLPTFTSEHSLNVPDMFSIGGSYQVTDNWGVFLEGKYIEYEDLEEGFSSLWGSDIMDFQREDFSMEDIWEIHFGSEYIYFVNEMPVAFRLGGYYEPAHNLEYESSTSSAIFPNIDKNFEDLMDGGEDVFHFTGGMGITIKNNFQLDVAVDIQDDTNKSTFIMSGVYNLM